MLNKFKIKLRILYKPFLLVSTHKQEKIKLEKKNIFLVQESETVVKTFLDQLLISETN